MCRSRRSRYRLKVSERRRGAGRSGFCRQLIYTSDVGTCRTDRQKIARLTKTAPASRITTLMLMFMTFPRHAALIGMYTEYVSVTSKMS